MELALAGIRDTVGLASGSLKNGVKDFGAYMKSTDLETIGSDARDAWLLRKTMAAMYSASAKEFLSRFPAIIRRNPKNILAFRKYPWLANYADMATYFDAVKGRTGPYREAILAVLRVAPKASLELVMDVLEHPERVVHVQSGGLMLIEILRSMNLVPFMDMTPPLTSVIQKPHSMEAYMDFAESEGIPADACSLARSAQGMLFKGHAPDAAAILGNNGCEGQVNSVILYQKMLKLPTFVLDLPNRYQTERAQEWFSKEILRMVQWFEENTPGKMDWEHLRELCEEKNRMVELEMELWEMTRLRPAPMAGEAIYLAHMLCSTLLGGTKAATALFQKLVGLTRQNLKRGVPAVPNERYRALLWHPGNAAFWHVNRYLELKWGVATVQESLTYNTLGFIDTSSRESMLKDLAKQVLNTPMTNIARGPSEYYIDTLLFVCEAWDIDMVVVSDHIGCKSTSAMKGILRDVCRERGIPVCFLPLDIMDLRFVSKEETMHTADQFMETVMNAEPLREHVPGI